MKKLSLYLHQDVLDTLKCFGDINDVINRVIKSSTDLEELYEEPINAAPPRDNCKRINVLIDDESYDSLGTIKVRPLIYWFVENEMYAQLEWEMVKDYGEDNKTKMRKQFSRALCELEKLNNMCNGNVSDIVNQLNNVRLQYETE